MAHRSQSFLAEVGLSCYEFRKLFPKGDPVAAASKPFRHPMLFLAVRNRLADRLVNEQGYPRRDAREAVKELLDETIEEAATKVAPHAKVGAGGFLQFLLDFISSGLFAKLLEILMSLFGGSPQAALTAMAPSAEPVPPA